MINKEREPIIMYQMGQPRVFPPYPNQREHWVTTHLLTETQYKEMIAFESALLESKGLVHNERGTIAKWKIYLK